MKLVHVSQIKRDCNRKEIFIRCKPEKLSTAPKRYKGVISTYTRNYPHYPQIKQWNYWEQKEKNQNRRFVNSDKFQKNADKKSQKDDRLNCPKTMQIAKQNIGIVA